MQYLKVLGYITLHLAELLSKSTYNKRNQLLRYKPLTRQPIVSASALVSKGLNSCYIVNRWVFSLRQHFFHVFICSKYIIAIQYLMWHELEPMARTRKCNLSFVPGLDWLILHMLWSAMCRQLPLFTCPGVLNQKITPASARKLDQPASSQTRTSSHIDFPSQQTKLFLKLILE